MGDPDTIETKAVHWSRCRRFAGKDFTLTPAQIKSVQHDFGKFKIRDFVDWRVEPEGNV